MGLCLVICLITTYVIAYSSVPPGDQLLRNMCACTLEFFVPFSFFLFESPVPGGVGGESVWQFFESVKITDSKNIYFKIGEL